MLESIEKVINSLNDSGIAYCHWKSNEHLDRALGGDTDLDVLFDPSMRSRLEQVLSACGMKRFRATPLMQYNAIEDYIGIDEKTAKIWHLHTHYRMTFGEKHLKGYTVTPWTSMILNERRQHESGIFCSCYEHELILLLVRIAMKLRLRDKGKKLGKDDIAELKWLLGYADRQKVAREAEKMLNADAANVIGEMLAGELSQKKQFEQLHRELLRTLAPFTGNSPLEARWLRGKRELFWLTGGIKRRMKIQNFHASRRISPAGGCVVAFLGSDGAGKSTTLAYVSREFNKKIDTQVIYFGSGDGSSSLLRRPMKLIAKRVGGKGLGDSVAKEQKSTRKKSLKSRLYGFGKLIWAVALAKEKKRKLKQMTKARNNGILVLTDRYPQCTFPGCNDGPLLDEFMAGKGLKARIARWEHSIYEMAAVNKPDLAIKLTVPTEIALQRKPEMTRQKIETKKYIVDHLSVAERTVTIDTSRNFETTRSEAMKAIWALI